MSSVPRWFALLTWTTLSILASDPHIYRNRRPHSVADCGHGTRRCDRSHVRPATLAHGGACDARQHTARYPASLRDRRTAVDRSAPARIGVHHQSEPGAVGWPAVDAAAIEPLMRFVVLDRVRAHTQCSRRLRRGDLLDPPGESGGPPCGAADRPAADRPVRISACLPRAAAAHRRRYRRLLGLSPGLVCTQPRRGGRRRDPDCGSIRRRARDPRALADAVCGPRAGDRDHVGHGQRAARDHRRFDDRDGLFERKRHAAAASCWPMRL